MDTRKKAHCCVRKSGIVLSSSALRAKVNSSRTIMACSAREDDQVGVRKVAAGYCTAQSARHFEGGRT